MANDKKEPMTVGKIIGLVTGAIVLAGMLLWGVPWWIAGTVRAQVTAELEALPPDPHPVSATDFATNTEKIANIEKVVLRMEAAMIARDQVILDYFQGKAREADDEN